ncbi:MAG TPA: MFS transporter [Anaerolineae bacterium]|nr:MFS transporter [Anaerolineae bacterium]
MSCSKRLQRIRDVYSEYPPEFWILLLGTFIDRLGGALVFPFLTLYISRKFDVGMTQIGVLFGVFSVTNIVGSMFGGALTDRLGRKRTLVLGLVASALTSLLMGLAESFAVLCAVVVGVGLFANVGGPAQQAMVADLLPEDKRAEGFGLVRVVANLCVAIGPIIGGLLATRSYLPLFIGDAVTSLITAGIVCALLRETKPAVRPGAEQETMLRTFRGYGAVARDVKFTLFVAIFALVMLMAMQMHTSLGIYLRDAHSVSVQRFGYILSLNATMVVLFQFYVTRRMKGRRPFIMLAVGSALYGFGYSLYGFVSDYTLFLLAMVIITTGEMVVSPTAQSLVARMAPEDMRGRYMAVYGFTWVLPGVVGPLAAGLIMDNTDPRWVWYAAGLAGLTAATGFGLLHRWIGDSIAAMGEPNSSSQ